MSRPRGRAATSLLELAISLALVATLASAAGLTLRGLTQATADAAARQDLRVLRGALDRYHLLEDRPLLGGRLAPLVPRFLAALPRDPWHAPYFFDGNLGVVGSFGADARQFGEGPDRDRVHQYRTYLRVVRARLLQGRRGRAEEVLEVLLSKPVRLTPEAADLVDREVMVRAPAHPDLALPLWAYGFVYAPERSTPAQGRLAFRVPEGTRADLAPSLGTGSRVALASFLLALRELPAPREETGLDDPSPYMQGPEPSSPGAPLEGTTTRPAPRVATEVSTEEATGGSFLLPAGTRSAILGTAPAR